LCQTGFIKYNEQIDRIDAPIELYFEFPKS